MGAYLAINALAFVDPVSRKVVRRRLEMNWYGVSAGSGVQAVLMVHPDSVPILVVETDQNPGGYFVTKIQLPERTGEQLGYAPK